MIRLATVDEAQLLSALALSSKAYWDYDPDFIEACRQDLTLSTHDITDNMVYVLEENQQIVGFYGLAPKEDDAVELEWFFIAPEFIHSGYGTRLWVHAIKTAREQGYKDLFLNSDPNATEFYYAMGAKRIGQSESSVLPGRMLPLLRYKLV